MTEIVQTVLLSLASIGALLVLSKLMGNKQISQLSMFDYIIGISIGSIAAEFATELENPGRSLTAMIVYAVCAYLVSVVTGKSTHLRKIIIGRPLILFDNGKLYRDNFRKARIDISDFLTHCRNQGYFDLSQLQTAVFEYNGSLSLLPAEGFRPLTPTDIHQNPEQQKVMVNVILDGNVNTENLKMTGNNQVWLERELHRQGFHEAKEVFLGIVNTVTNSLSLYAADVGPKTVDPFE